MVKSPEAQCLLYTYCAFRLKSPFILNLIGRTVLIPGEKLKFKPQMNFNTQFQAPNTDLPFTMPTVQQLSFVFTATILWIMDMILIHFFKTILNAL